MPDTAQFLADLSKDPYRALWLQQHPEALRETAGLSEEEAEVLAGDEEGILAWLGQDSIEMMIMIPGEDEDDEFEEDEDDEDVDEVGDEDGDDRSL
jgi:hypothetical protein